MSTLSGFKKRVVKMPSGLFFSVLTVIISQLSFFISFSWFLLFDPVPHSLSSPLFIHVLHAMCMPRGVCVYVCMVSEGKWCVCANCKKAASGRSAFPLLLLPLFLLFIWDELQLPHYFLKHFGTVLFQATSIKLNPWPVWPD